LIGLIFGIVGKGLYLAGIQQYISIIAGVLMILSVLMPSSYFTKSILTKSLYKIFAAVKSNLGFYLNQRSKSTFFFIGIFNGFLPCGLVYMALMGALVTSNAAQGAVYMALFGLGTIPMMSTAVLFGNFLKTSVRNKFKKLIPVVVVIIGILFILRGLGLGIPYISPSNSKLNISITG
jgi:hypothetical protein